MCIATTSEMMPTLRALAAGDFEHIVFSCIPSIIPEENSENHVLFFLVFSSSEIYQQIAAKTIQLTIQFLRIIADVPSVGASLVFQGRELEKVRLVGHDILLELQQKPHQKHTLDLIMIYYFKEKTSSFGLVK